MDEPVNVGCPKKLMFVVNLLEVVPILGYLYYVLFDPDILYVMICVSLGIWSEPNECFG